MGYCHREEAVAGWFHASVLKTVEADAKGARRLRGRRVAVASGPQVDLARNEICRQFLELPGSPEWLWMIDADMSWEPEAFDLLCRAADEADRPVIGGLCFAGGAGGTNMWPVMLVFDRPAPDEIAIRRVVSYPPNTICKVDATGAAFLLMHRRVLLELDDGSQAPWFRYSYLGEQRIGEDVAFCMRLYQKNIPVFVHTGVKVGHAKTTLLTEDMYLEQRRRAALEKEEAS